MPIPPAAAARVRSWGSPFRPLLRRSLSDASVRLHEGLTGGVVWPDVPVTPVGTAGKCNRPGCDQCLGNSIDGSGVPIYGNWCGPGHGSGVPIDAVDAACMRHDKCYSERGYSDCECDSRLIDEMPAAIARTASTNGKACGGLIAGSFSLLPCICRNKVCYPEVGTCEFTMSYPCGVKYCSRKIEYPCGIKWCSGPFGVKYPCGVKTCSETISYACGTEWCDTKVPYPCVTGVECSLVPTGIGAGGRCPEDAMSAIWGWQPARGISALSI